MAYWHRAVPAEVPADLQGFSEEAVEADIGARVPMREIILAAAFMNAYAAYLAPDPQASADRQTEEVRDRVTADAELPVTLDPIRSVDFDARWDREEFDSVMRAVGRYVRGMRALLSEIGSDDADRMWGVFAASTAAYACHRSEDPDGALDLFGRCLDTAVQYVMINADETLASEAEGRGYVHGMLRMADIRQERGDLKGAADRFRRAADMGDADGMFMLGVFYDNGYGVKRSAEEAFRYYTMAAERGHSMAMTNIGSMYDEGVFVERSIDEAVRWYRRAADLGNPMAVYNLAICYEDGDGVERSMEEAVRLLESIADMYPDAAAELRRLRGEREGIGAGGGI